MLIQNLGNKHFPSSHSSLYLILFPNITISHYLYFFVFLQFLYTMLGSTQPLTEMSTRKIPGGKARPARKADNLTAICEPIV
jgi:hypothetical protein